jgi:hypothetical protein
MYFPFALGLSPKAKKRLMLLTIKVSNRTKVLERGGPSLHSKFLILISCVGEGFSLAVILTLSLASFPQLVQKVFLIKQHRLLL